jgi:hypothetical protein
VKGDAAASSAPNNPAGRGVGGGAAAVAGRLRHGRRRQHGILAAATGARVAVPVLPGAAAWGVVGAVPLVAAAAVGGDAPSGPGVLAVRGVPRRRRGGGGVAAAAAARCALCFLAAFAVTLAVAALDGCDVSVVVFSSIGDQDLLFFFERS